MKTQIIPGYECQVIPTVNFKIEVPFPHMILGYIQASQAWARFVSVEGLPRASYYEMMTNHTNTTPTNHYINSFYDIFPASAYRAPAEYNVGVVSVGQTIYPEFRPDAAYRGVISTPQGDVSGMIIPVHFQLFNGQYFTGSVANGITFRYNYRWGGVDQVWNVPFNIDNGIAYVYDMKPSGPLEPVSRTQTAINSPIMNVPAVFAMGVLMKKF